jgi:hypothetical protein
MDVKKWIKLNDHSWFGQDEQRIGGIFFQPNIATDQVREFVSHLLLCCCCHAG